jgi:hypothetical protein
MIDSFNADASAKLSQLAKEALLERLVRLGATDVEKLPGVRKVIKSTPRMVMRHRTPQELASLEKGVKRTFRKVEAPLERKLHKATSKLPGKVKKVVRKGGKMIIRNPEQIPLQAVPIPGISPAALAGKKVLEKGIDRLAPAVT